MLLSAEFAFALTPALEEALEKGIPLYFTIEFELVRTRFLWFPQKVAEWSISYRVSYNSLTRQYRVSSGPLGQTFESLDDVQRFIGHVASRPVARADDLVEGRRYEAAVREKLDVNQLPKPFQVNALASRDWQLASDWHRFASRHDQPARLAAAALGHAGIRVRRGDRALPARDRDGEHGPVRRSLQHARADQRRRSSRC